MKAWLRARKRGRVLRLQLAVGIDDRETLAEQSALVTRTIDVPLDGCDADSLVAHLTLIRDSIMTASVELRRKKAAADMGRTVQ